MNRAIKVVVGYDGSECADRALEDLGRAGIPDGSDLIVLSVSEWFPTPVGVSGVEGLAVQPSGDQSVATELAERGASLIKASYPNWNVQAEGYAGSPAHEIIRRAEDWGADLIVVGSHGRGVVGRLVLGSISQQIVHTARCSVRIARPQERKEIVNIVLGIDGSDYTDRLLEVLVSRSWNSGTSVSLVSAAEFSYDQKEENAILQRLQELHERIEAKLKEHHLDVRSVIDTAMIHPKRLLLSEAEKIDADMIMLGARGLTGVERFILGSVSTAVAMQAKCSVEIVHKALSIG